MRLIVSLALALFLATVAAPMADAPLKAAELAPPDYNLAVAPLLAKYCNGCHNSDDREGKLSLASFEELKKGGKRGAVVVPGQSAQSRLIRVLTGDAKPAMPPEDNPRPSPAEIALLTAWIDAGAKGPSGAEVDPTVLIVPKVDPAGPVRRAIFAAAFSPDGPLLALGRPGAVDLVSADTRAVVRTFTGLHGNVNSLAFSADGAVLVAAAGEPGLFGEVVVFDLARNQPPRRLRGHKDSIYAVALSSDRKLLATGSYDQQIKLWDLATGGELRTLSGHNGAVFSLDFHKNGRVLASASGDRTVKLWNVDNGERVETFGQPTLEQYAVVFSPDGQSVAAAGADNRIRIWRLSDSMAEGTNPLVFARFAHEQPIVKLAYSPDGKTIATAAEDRKVKLWQADQVSERLLLDAQSDVPVALAFSPKQSTLAVGRLDGSLSLYSVVDGAMIAPAPMPKPELISVLPRGVQRGQPALLRISGKHLSESDKVTFGDARLTGKLTAADASTGALQLEVTSSADLPRGAYDVWLENSSGASGKLQLYVDDLPQTLEAEPNDTHPAAQSISLPTAVWGRLQTAGDRDRFSFEGRQGQVLVIDLNGRSLGGKGDCLVSVFDPEGKLLEPLDEVEGHGEPLLAVKLPINGRYSVQVNDFILAGGPDTEYRLSIGEFPFVVACYPPVVPANKSTTVALVGFNIPDGTEVQVAAAGSQEAEAPIDGNRFRTRRPVTVQVSAATEEIEREPNDSPTQAVRVTAPGGVSGRIDARSADAPADVDHYQFTAKKGQTLILETTARRRGAPVDTRLDVLDSAGRPIERVLLQAVRDSFINFRTINSSQTGVRLKNWEEMELNDLVYFNGEVCKLFRAPQGPDSDSVLYESTPGVRRTYFDTSAAVHANYDPAYIVTPFPPGSKLAFNGLPVFPLYFSNDDASDRDIATDSRVTFTAPDDGTYLVRVTDTAGRGGDRYIYRLTLRAPQPDFKVALAGANPTVPAGSGQSFTLTRERIDGFDGDIRIDVEGQLPPGFSVTTPLVIEAGHRSATGTIVAAADAPPLVDPNASPITLKATALIDGREVSHPVGSLGKIALGPAPQVSVQLIPEPGPGESASSLPTDEKDPRPLISIAPGSTVSARLKIVRNGHTGPVSLDVLNLPHGVIVDNIGLNAVLITPSETERQIFLTAAGWVGEQTRLIHAVARVDKNATSGPVVLQVRKPAAEVSQAK